MAGDNSSRKDGGKDDCASAETQITRHGTEMGTIQCGSGCGFSDAASRAADAKERSASMTRLWVAIILCLIFMGVEVAGGIKANSLAVLTDAAHLLSDVAGFAISLFAIWAAGWEATPRQTFGFFRLEILGALVSIQLIWLITGILVYEAIDRIIHKTGKVNGMLMFIVATFGLLVNLVMVFLLGHSHGHGHGHGHDDGHGHGEEHGHEHDHEHGHKHSYNVDHRHGRVGADDGHGHGEEHGHNDEHGHEHDHEHGHKHSYNVDHRHGRVGAVEGTLREPLLSPRHLDSEHRSHIDDSDEGFAHRRSITENINPQGGTLRVDEDIEAGTRDSVSQKKNINVQGAYLHVLGDLIQSIGVMIGGGVIWWKPEWRIIDLICTLFFSVIVLGTTINMLRSILEVLMESTPREIDATRLEEGLVAIPGVLTVHELHIWAITVGKSLLACHVRIQADADADAILQNVIGYCERTYKISHVTVQIEREPM